MISLGVIFLCCFVLAFIMLAVLGAYWIHGLLSNINFGKVWVIIVHILLLFLSLSFPASPIALFKLFHNSWIFCSVGFFYVFFLFAF